jgi:branched-chain amino acid aminotransferase
VVPISDIKSEKYGIWMPEPAERISLSLRQELTDIQYGRREDKHGWLLRLDA